MKEQFVPAKPSLDLKELGFDETCFGVYIDNKLIIEDDWLYATNNDTFIESNNSAAPTFSQAFRFFREKYGLDSFVHPTWSTKYQFRMVHLEGKSKVQIYGEYMGKEYKSHPEAELACLKKLIEIVKNK